MPGLRADACKASNTAFEDRVPVYKFRAYWQSFNLSHLRSVRTGPRDIQLQVGVMSYGQGPAGGVLEQIVAGAALEDDADHGMRRTG